MAFHLVFYSGTVANATTALTPLTPVSDPVSFTSGNQLFLGPLSNFIGGYVLGNAAKRAQFSTPSLLSLSPYEANPIDANATPSSPVALQLNPTNPIKLVSGEPLTVSTTNDAATGATTMSAVAFLSDGAIAPVNGNIIRWRATATTPATGYAWGNATLTFSTSLAEGTYQIVGARVEAAHGIAYRFVFQNSASIRPGGLCVGSAAALDYPAFRNGMLGAYGTFTNLTPPTVDFITDGTSDTADIYLDLIKTA